MEFTIFLFIAFAFVFFVRKVMRDISSNRSYSRAKSPSFSPSSISTSGDYKPEYRYSLNEALLTSAEIRYYKHLENVIGDNMKVFSKVRLLDVFTPKDKDAFASMRKISSKHVDFLVCENRTFKPLFAIELDDSSHRSKQSQERDIFVNSVFKSAGLTLHRVECKGSYSEPETIAMLNAS